MIQTCISFSLGAKHRPLGTVNLGDGKEQNNDIASHRLSRQAPYEKTPRTISTHLRVQWFLARRCGTKGTKPRENASSALRPGPRSRATDARHHPRPLQLIFVTRRPLGSTSSGSEKLGKLLKAPDSRTQVFGPAQSAPRVRGAD